MRIAILALGFRGDVQPMLAIGEELRRRGHSVVLTVNVNLVPWANRSGLEIVPIEPDYEAFTKSPEGIKVLSTGRFITASKEMNAREQRANAQISQTCIDACRGADVVASTMLTVYRGMCLGEKLKVPHGALLTFPTHQTAEWSSLALPVRDFRWRALNRASYELFNRVWWRDCEPNIREMRQGLGLAPMRALPSTDHLPTALLFSDALVPRPSDWARHNVLTGSVTLQPELRERVGESTPPNGLGHWLDSGEPPVFFGFGSMPVMDPAAMLAQIAEVTAARRVRGLIGAGWTDYTKAGGKLPAHLYITSSFDHDRVLPRCRAAVHHGGAGTTSTVLRAVLPTVVASVYADQPYWGWRIEQMGAGTTFPFRKMSAQRLDRALGVVIRERVQYRARELGTRMRKENGAARAAEVVESWVS